MKHTQVDLVFTSYTRLMQNSEGTILGDTDFLRRIIDEAKGAGLHPTEGFKTERHNEPPWAEDSKLDHYQKRKSLFAEDKNILYEIPPFGSQEFWNSVQIVGVSIAGATVFLRNVLGIWKDARDLKKQMVLSAKIDGNEVSVRNSEELQKLIDRIILTKNDGLDL